MSIADPAFSGAGQKPGLEIWRIEKVKVVSQDVRTYGEFYTGDSYIIMHTKKPPGSDKFEWNIHFWLGKETSQDEQGVAAYKTVELDDSLGGAPVQFREVQDHESKLFLSYFNNGIKYLSGGIESGFKKVERGKYEKRLFEIKGKKNVRARQVKCHCSSLNQGDVFLLDTGLTLHLWVGPNSSMFERMKGIEVANRIRDEERSGKARIRIIDSRWNSDSYFFKDLGSEGNIAEASIGGDDAEFEKKLRVEVKLYRVSDASGNLEVTEVAKRPLHQQDLDSNDCFILDSGPSGIFVWVGKSCTKNEKKSAWSHATNFLQYKGYPDWTKVTRVVEEGETPVFKQYFASWKERDEQSGLGKAYSTGNIAKMDSSIQIDYTKMHLKQPEKESKLSDDENGEIEVWRVQNNDIVPVETDTIGAFCSSASYVLLYTYQRQHKTHYIIYYWQNILKVYVGPNAPEEFVSPAWYVTPATCIRCPKRLGGNAKENMLNKLRLYWISLEFTTCNGNRSTLEDKAAAAIYAKKLDDDELSGTGAQVRVVQGREPDQFLNIFKGRMIIFMGDGDTDESSNTTRMFHVRGTNEKNTRAVEVPPSFSSLNSNDVFFVIGEFDTYLWVGKMSETIEFETSKKLIDFLTPDRSLLLIKEGEEPEAFWESIGGSGSYAKSKNERKGKRSFYPRLFVCSNTSGKFTVEEVQNYTQEDLSEGDVAILDTFDEIFVWIGNKANATERKEGLKAAVQYLRADPHGRTEKTTPLLHIKQGSEPPTFKSQFHGWNHKLWKQIQRSTSTSSANEDQQVQQHIQSHSNNVTNVSEELEQYDKFFSYQELTRKRPPAGVDPTCKEKYLTDEEFEQVFGMTKAEYYTKPKWRQVDHKKKVNLF